ncbi:MAG: (2Fe-2S)-binding protein [Acidimicrobiia bacterium]
MCAVTTRVNGRPTAFVAPARESLADALRHRCHVRSVHLGCEHGVCGACTVLVDGVTARSCLMLAVQADGHDVTTLEATGTGSTETVAKLQDSFSRHHALQCGFCTPGFLMAAAELLDEHPEPSGLDAHTVREALSGNLCRCTGYHNIVRAVLDAAGAPLDDGSPAVQIAAVEIGGRG